MLDRTTTLSQDLPRQILAVAIADYDAAALKHRNAVVAADHAKAMMGQARDHLLDFTDLQVKVTTYRADRIRTWSAGGAAGAQPTMDLPPDLEEAIDARDLAEADAASAKAVYRQLADDVEAAALMLQRAQGAVSAAADAVLVETAEEVADELGAAQSLVNALRFRFRAFASIRPALRLSGRARDLAEYPREPFLIPNANPQQQEFSNVQTFHARLLTNPDSVLDRSS
jgi:hypothetical protein